MSKSNLEFYRRNEYGKLVIDWQGVENDGKKVLDNAQQIIKDIEHLLIVVESDPETASTCMRMLLLLAREANRLKINHSVVIADQNLAEAVKITGYDRFFAVFMNEVAALENMGVANFYPLSLIRDEALMPDPKAA